MFLHRGLCDTIGSWRYVGKVKPRLAVMSRRRDLKPKAVVLPRDPATLTPDALARREAYRREEAERQEAAHQRAVKAKERTAEQGTASGKRVTTAGDAPRRHR